MGAGHHHRPSKKNNKMNTIIIIIATLVSPLPCLNIIAWKYTIILDSLSIFDPSAHLVQAQRKSMFRSRLLFCRPMRNLLRKGKPHAPFQVDPQPATTCCVGLLENGFFAKTQSGNIASQQNFHTISNVTRFGHTWFEPTPAQVRMQPEQTRLFGSVIKKRKKKMNKHKLRKLRRKLRRKKNG